MIRKEPGMGGSGKFYRVGIRDKNEFIEFRNHDVGRRGHVERLAGKRADGSWDSVAWLIAKDEAKIEKGFLVGRSDDVREVLEKLGSRPKHLKGDIIEAKIKKS